MKSVQKFGSLLLAALMILSLTACGSKTNNTPAQTPSNDTPTENTPAETPDDAATGDADNTASGGKVLVVYYSASGNTKRVAEDIAEAADGDLFEITPAEPYTSDDLNWTNSDSRVSREHDDESLRDVPLHHRGRKLGRLRHRVYRLSHLVGHRSVARGHLCKKQ